MMEILSARKASLPNFGSFHRGITNAPKRRSSHSHLGSKAESKQSPFQSVVCSTPDNIGSIYGSSSQNFSVDTGIHAIGSSHSQSGSLQACGNLDDDAILIEFMNHDNLRVSPCLIFSHYIHDISDRRSQLSEDFGKVSFFTLTIPIDTRMHHVVEVYQLNDKRILVVIENYWTKCTELYLDTIRNIIGLVRLRTPFIILKTQCHFTALNQLKGILALYDAIGTEVRS
ncbi:hypothetical protein K493DRAFT_387792 [Basidiobolus meristosporus CBS 931.73]|uniref:Uncharacterized protein n=1 Tax=Basidiobolus meristosporus CBS 931.73 TaxID=1314790 RepID=A0A1Y1YVC9_9FUNG|nr:hypothetical protein K493DRAFT_387792 [Basidiobolus meristosporus CBS 931.73]|eukprot:ORY01926.1 hypothetical protein K493DRAFT_387792 [Basidiobolus meristosporus CBS 931.73]